MKNPYEGSRTVPVEGRVPPTSFQLFWQRMLRGALFGAIVLGGLVLATVLYIRNQATEESDAQELLLNMREWSDAYAFGVSPLIAWPLLYGIFGAVLGALLGATYHVVAQLVRKLVRRS